LILLLQILRVRAPGASASHLRSAIGGHSTWHPGHSGHASGTAHPAIGRGPHAAVGGGGTGTAVWRRAHPAIGRRAHPAVGRATAAGLHIGWRTARRWTTFRVASWTAHHSRHSRHSGHAAHAPHTAAASGVWGTKDNRFRSLRSLSAHRTARSTHHAGHTGHSGRSWHARHSGHAAVRGATRACHSVRRGCAAHSIWSAHHGSHAG